MAGSLPRPPSQFSFTYKTCSPSKYKSIAKLPKQRRSLRTKGSDQKSGKKSSSHKNRQQLNQQLLLQRLKYCQSLSLSNLVLLLPASLLLQFYDSCRTTAAESKKFNNKHSIKLAIKYAQQQQQQQQNNQYHQLLQHQQQQELQVYKKIFKFTKFHKNLLNRKKLQKP